MFNIFKRKLTKIEPEFDVEKFKKDFINECHEKIHLFEELFDYFSQLDEHKKICLQYDPNKLFELHLKFTNLERIYDVENIIKINNVEFSISFFHDRINKENVDTIFNIIKNEIQRRFNNKKIVDYFNNKLFFGDDCIIISHNKLEMAKFWCNGDYSYKTFKLTEFGDLYYNINVEDIKNSVIKITPQIKTLLTIKHLKD